MSRKSLNVSIEPDVLDEFCKYAGPKGIKISAWVNAKMREFIEAEKESGSQKPSKKERT